MDNDVIKTSRDKVAFGMRKTAIGKGYGLVGSQRHGKILVSCHKYVIFVEEDKISLCRDI